MTTNFRVAVFVYKNPTIYNDNKVKDGSPKFKKNNKIEKKTIKKRLNCC